MQGQHTYLRTPVEELRLLSPQLADELEDISLKLDAASISAPLAESERKLHHTLAARYEMLIVQARSIPGLEGFLKPKRLAKFLHAASRGPVITLLATRASCHALILRPSSNTVLHVPLPNCRPANIAEMRKSFTRIVQVHGQARSSDQQRAVMHATHCTSLKDKLCLILLQLWMWVVLPVLESLDLVVSQVSARVLSLQICRISQRLLAPS